MKISKCNATLVSIVSSLFISLDLIPEKHSYTDNAFCNIFLRGPACCSLGCLDKDICIYSCIPALPTFSCLRSAIPASAIAVRKH